MTQRVVLITGASSGIGRVTAEHFAKEGEIVYGTSRRPSCEVPGVRMLSMDVTQDDSIAKGIDQIIAEQGRIDVLVNNAGIAHLSTFEETTLQDMMPVFDTNLFGVLRVTRSVLPHMRTQRTGCIINVGSMAARAGLPGLSLYGVTKAGLVGFSDALRYEVREFGIRVVVVEPGRFRSNLAPRSRLARQHLVEYSSLRERLMGFFGRGIENAPEPLPVARCILKISQVSRPRLRYIVGVDAYLISWLRRLLPDRVFAGLVLKATKLDRNPLPPSSVSTTAR